MKFAVLLLVLGAGSAALAKSTSSEPERIGVVDAAIESLTGDVYAQPSKWRPLSLGTFFSEGWDQAWASPTNGSGGAPRQGLLAGIDVPVTNPQPYDFQPTVGLMKVF
jgi:hypothetical protein